MPKHFPVEIPPGMSAGHDHAGADEAGREFLNGREAHKRKGKSMDDLILDSDIEPETVEFSEAELETLEMTLEFFLDGYCDGEE